MLRYDKTSFDTAVIEVLRAAFVTLSLCIALFASSTQGALARDFVPFGDSGTTQATDRCPTKQYLVGLFVRAGDWMDQLGIICAPVDINGNTGAPSFGPPRGGTGGAPPFNVTCGVNQITTGVSFLMTPENKQVRMLRFYCASQKDASHQNIDVGNTTHGPPSAVRQDCPADQAITGVIVNYGVHVNAFAIICGERPVLAPPPAGGPGATFPPSGDRGTNQAQDSCPAKQYLVGLFARVGDWMDQLGIICAPVDAAGNTGAPSFGPPRGGAGGAPPVNVTCAVNEIMTGVGFLMTPENRQVRMLGFTCVSEKTSQTHVLDIGNTTHGPLSGPRQDCPAGQAITGVIVNYGIHVNAFAIVCGQKPTVAALPAGGGTTTACTTDGAPLTADQQAVCTEHNVERDKHGTPHVAWSTRLAASAQAWAAGCHKDAKGSFCHEASCGGGSPYGENLASRATVVNGQPVLPALQGAQAVDGWYCEVNNYVFSDNPTIGFGTTSGCGPTNMVTGHFTQVVWKATTQVGCAEQTCPVTITDSTGKTTITQGTLWVCKYNPAGNNTDPAIIKQNVLPLKH